MRKMIIYGVKLTKCWLRWSFSLILIVPTLSDPFFGAFSFVWSHCLGNFCSSCCFGIFLPFLVMVSRDYRKCCEIFLVWMIFIFDALNPFRLVITKTLLYSKGYIWYDLSSLFTNSNLAWCVNWLLVCARKVMVFVAIFY